MPPHRVVARPTTSVCDKPHRAAQCDVSIDVQHSLHQNSIAALRTLQIKSAAAPKLNNCQGPLVDPMRSLKLACIRDGHNIDITADPSQGWDEFLKFLKKKFGMPVWLRYSNRQKETVSVCDSQSYREFLAFCRLRALKDGVEEVRCAGLAEPTLTCDTCNHRVLLPLKL
jgi:hypothetical protein